jgi:hypothetical protein
LNVSGNPRYPTRAIQVPARPNDDVQGLKADVNLLKWMLGFVLAFQVGIFIKLFTH